jgi:chromosome segregation ATPase
MGMVGAAAVVALLAVVFKSFRANNKSVTDQDLVRYLRACLEAEIAKTANAEARLELVQGQLVNSQFGLNSMDSNLSTARDEISTLKSDIEMLTRENEDRAYGLKSVRAKLSVEAVAQKNFTIASLKERVRELHATIEHFDIESNMAGAALINV